MGLLRLAISKTDVKTLFQLVYAVIALGGILGAYALPLAVCMLAQHYLGWSHMAGSVLYAVVGFACFIPIMKLNFRLMSLVLSRDRPLWQRICAPAAYMGAVAGLIWMAIKL